MTLQASGPAGSTLEGAPVQCADTQTLRMALAVDAFRLIDRDTLTVSAELDLHRPETLSAFKQFQDILQMAYQAGQAQGVGPLLAAFRAGQLEAGIPHEDVMPVDPVEAVTYLVKLAPEWR